MNPLRRITLIPFGKTGDSYIDGLQVELWPSGYAKQGEFGCIDAPEWIPSGRLEATLHGSSVFVSDVAVSRRASCVSRAGET